MAGAFWLSESRFLRTVTVGGSSVGKELDGRLQYASAEPEVTNVELACLNTVTVEASFVGKELDGRLQDASADPEVTNVALACLHALVSFSIRDDGGTAGVEVAWGGGTCEGSISADVCHGLRGVVLCGLDLTGEAASLSDTRP